MAGLNKSELLSNFMSITGSNEEQANFCLSAADWDLPNAIEIHYQGNDGDEETTAVVTGEQEPMSQSAAPVTVKKTSRIATIGSMKREEEEEDDSSEEGQAFYAGGSEHGGGQQVLGPRRKKKETEGLIGDMFKAAKEHGAEEVEAGSSSQPSVRTPQKFQGSGYRLGETEEESDVVQGAAAPSKPRQVDMVLKLWRNGFSIDDGDLRDYRDQENQEFLDTIKKGEVPQELIRQARGGEVSLNMEDHREEEFVPPKKTVKAFSGSGNRLGSAAPTVVSSASQPENDQSEKAAKSSISLDKTQPVTNIQIRLSDGSRLVAQFNHSHTVGDIRQYITSARPHMTGSNFALMTTFPNKELTQERQSIADAKLMNAVIVQRMK